VIERTLPDHRKPGVYAIHEVAIGTLPADGGTRTRVVRIGGQTTMPFYHLDGDAAYPPAITMEVADRRPIGWPSGAIDPVSDVCNDPAAWARRCVESFGADLLCLRLSRETEDGGVQTPERAVTAARQILRSVGVPLIVWGTGDDDLDALLLAAIAEETAGERCLLGTITEKSYRTLTAVAIAFGHSVIAESPVDINMAKQINILAMDAGFPEDRLVIYPTTGALGYGIEYVVSIMERLRLAGLKGDRIVAMPIVADVGREAWAVKEAKAPESEKPEWGDEAHRGPAWETASALMYLHAGADLVIVRHPETVRALREAVDRLSSRDAPSSST